MALIAGQKIGWIYGISVASVQGHGLEMGLKTKKYLQVALDVQCGGWGRYTWGR